MSKVVTFAALVSNDTLETFQIEVVDDLDNPIDITGYTINLHVSRPAPTAPLVKTATIIDASMGLAQVTWSAGDLIPGNHNFEVQITTAGGDIKTFPDGCDDIWRLETRKEIA